MSTIIYRLLFFIGFTMNVCAVTGQEQQYWPVQFYDVFGAVSISNPADFGDEKLAVTTHHQSFLGALSNINASYVDGFVHLDRDGSQVTGVSIFHEQEGDFFNRTAMYVRYAMSLDLSHKIKLKGGARLGMFNYLIAPGPSSGGVSFWLPDGHAGMMLSSEKWEAGFSMNQLFNASTGFAARKLIMSRYWSAHFSRLFELSNKWGLRTGSKVHWLSSDFVLSDISALLLFESFYLGGGLRFRHGWNVQAGIKDISFSGFGGAIDMIFFQQRGGLAIPGARQVEVSLRLFME